MAKNMRRALAVGVLGGLGLVVAPVLAGPAQAHNANYNCTTDWLINGASLNCTGGVPGDSAQLRLICIQISGSGTQTKFSAAFRNGTTTLGCSTGYEPLSKSYRENYADGHTTGWIA